MKRPALAPTLLRSLALSTLLAGGLASAQVSILSIPALPQQAGAAAPAPTSAPAPTTPAPAYTAPIPLGHGPQISTSLPSSSEALGGTYTVSLDGPASIRAGQAQHWTFKLSNHGQSTLHTEHGACDVRFEVVNARGQVVRADPTNTLCTMQLVIFDAVPGQTATLQTLTWAGQDSSGQSLPAGDYVIRAKFFGGGRETPLASAKVTVK